MSINLDGVNHNQKHCVHERIGIVDGCVSMDLVDTPTDSAGVINYTCELSFQYQSQCLTTKHNYEPDVSFSRFQGENYIILREHVNVAVMVRLLLITTGRFRNAYSVNFFVHDKISIQVHQNVSNHS